MTVAELLRHWRLVENPFRGEEARLDDVLARMSRQDPLARSGDRTGDRSSVDVAAARPPQPSPSADRSTPAQPSTSQPIPRAPQPDDTGGSIRDASDMPTGAAAPAVAYSGIYRPRPIHHGEFEKILGDLARPSSAVVFGEKGSGKTAIRLQIGERVAAYNSVHLGARVLLVPYDDLNAVLDRLHERLGGSTSSSSGASRTGNEPQSRSGRTAIESLQKMRLVDHLDALLLATVPRVVDTILGVTSASRGGSVDADAASRRASAATASALATPPSPANEPLHVADIGGPNASAATTRAHKRLNDGARRDLLLLQALYDHPDRAPERTRALRSKLRISRGAGPMVRGLFAVAAPLVILALVAWTRVLWDRYPAPSPIAREWVEIATLAATSLFALWALKVGVWDKLALLRIAHRVRRQIRVSPRGDVSYARSLRELGRALPGVDALPTTDSEEARYALLDRLRGVLRPLGYAGIIVIVDRVDEPTLVSGDPDRMKAVIWPMLNNKFLQQEGMGVKMLLPMDLRHALFRESSAFFQEARLDKQCLVERLGWTGVSLYDLCDARLVACSAPGRTPVTLVDLFEEDVTRQDLIDALDRMHQPRDAFKFLYRCMTEHCAAHRADERRPRIPRHIMQSVLKSEVERVQGLYRGIRPG